MPTKGKSITQRTLQILAVFAVVGMTLVGIQLLAASPCDIPRTWSVGRVDPQFGLSKQMVAQYGKESTDIWNTSYKDNPLFAYRENGGEITLNFVYDERMQTTLRNQRLKRSIAEGKGELTEIKETLASLQGEYKQLGETVASLTKTYTADLNAYNKEAAYWNSQGGAPKDTYDKLQEEEQKLEDERNDINSKIRYYNQLGEKIRTYGENHNEIVKDLNEKINTLNETAMQEFEEGIYDPNDKSITVYEYASPVALKRVLAHEFGHSIGIGHVAGENSIMFAINQGRNLTLSEQDLAALQATCQKKDLNDFLQFSTQAFGIIRDGISRLAG